jgi:transposase
MPSNAELKLMTQLLNLPEMKVKNYKLIKQLGVSLYIENEAKAVPCPNCGKTTNKLHQNHRYVVRDLPIMEQPVYLQVNRRQMRCADCNHKFSEDLKGIPKKRTYTQRFRQKILSEVVEGTISRTAKKYGVSEQEVETMLKDLEDELLEKKPQGMKRLGIDEIAVVKGQKNYYTVFVDLDTGKLIGLLNKRTQSDICQYLKSWGSEALSQIEEVSIDLWKPYKKVAEELMPQASIVADRFHVMKQVNQELDQGRKNCKKEVCKEKNTANKRRKESALNKSKYALLKNFEDLNAEQIEKIKEIEIVLPDLAKKYQLKEEFRKIFETSENWSEGILKLADWLKKALNHFSQSCQTIQSWIGEIIAYFDRRTTQGMVEGVNNKLKLIKRKAYGFRNFYNFKIRSQLSMIILD